jgi:hypothetical protein
MKVLLVIAALIACVTSAAANLSPYPSPPLAFPSTDAIYLGPTGTLLEADYFDAPSPRYGAARIFPCQPRLHADRSRAAALSCD